MIKNTLRYLKENLAKYQLQQQNKKGPKFSQKYLVISSDDWGSIRTPSYDSYCQACLDGKTMDKDPFLKYDCLESEEDLSMLFSVLKSYKDYYGSTPIITANFAMANPAFELIKAETGYYQRELFYESYAKIHPNDAILEVIKKGIDLGLFLPQLHCMEHLRVEKWMSDLVVDKEVQYAFNHHMVGTYNCYSNKNRFGYMDELNYTKAYYNNIVNDIKTASKVFEDSFGYKSVSFVPSCNVWKDDIYRILSECGISIIQCGNHQFKPTMFGTLKKRHHYSGQKTKYEQRFVVRNCYLEHIFSDNPSWSAKNCLSMVESAFAVGAPAIIDSHRVNYVSGIFKKNRDNGLEMLDAFLSLLLKKYPDVVFISVSDLGGLIDEKNG